MKVILQEDVPKLGAMGDVEVRDGYGRISILGLAIIADEKNVRKLKHMQGLHKQKQPKNRRSTSRCCTCQDWICS